MRPEAVKQATPRTLMVRRLTDIIVLPPGKVSSNDRALAGDLMLQVLDKVEREFRIEVARRVSRVTECPIGILRALMLDEPEISCLVLENAEHLPEALMIEVAKLGQIEQRLSIAGRINISTAISDALLQHDELPVFEKVLKRKDCRLSPDVVNKAVALSATYVPLQELLLRRSEMEPCHGFMMFWWVGREARKRILTRFAIDRAIIQDAFSDLYPRVFRSKEPPDPFVKEILILAERRHRPRGLNGEPVSMDVVKQTLRVAHVSNAKDVVEATAMVAGVSQDLTQRILMDESGEAFAILAKSLNIPRGEYYDFFGVHDRTEREYRENADYLMGIFDSIGRDFARAILRYWDWSGNPRISRISALLDQEIVSI